MDSGVQFGAVRERTPESRQRPDRDGSLAVCAWGNPRAEDLPIFIDWQAAQAIQSHAYSNTEVELGGVLLGYACVDDGGQPFVIVAASVAAEHYVATRGSFKFTHDSWSEISRQRSQLDPQLQMVGWYHTHPGWGVFLSGMDDFICQNFFARELDLALVVDPCGHDWGWFQWTADQQTERCGGFYVTAPRERRGELQDFVERERKRMMDGKRRLERLADERPTTDRVQIQVVERQPWIGLGVLGLLALQTGLLLTLVAYRAGPAGGVAADPDPVRLAWEETRRELLAARVEADVYRDLFRATLNDPAGGEPDWIEQLAQAQLKSRQFESSNRSLALRNDQLERELAQWREEAATATSAPTPIPGTLESGAAGEFPGAAVDSADSPAVSGRQWLWSSILGPRPGWWIWGAVGLGALGAALVAGGWWWRQSHAAATSKG